jgi:hypothetical protein
MASSAVAVVLSTIRIGGVDESISGFPGKCTCLSGAYQIRSKGEASGLPGNGNYPERV